MGRRQRRTGIRELGMKRLPMKSGNILEQSNDKINRLN
tara:strand:- start:1390 stop:1503 length:114 start_codon:yes stop_codon:yes gene_type:complete